MFRVTLADVDALTAVSGGIRDLSGSEPQQTGVMALGTPKPKFSFTVT
jgi:hypothetical protein